MHNQTEIIEYLQKNDIGLKCDFPLSTISYLKIGGPASLYVTPEEMSQLLDLIKYLQAIKSPFKVIGNASNCLFSDSAIDRVIISPKKLNNITFAETDDVVTAETGAMLPVLVKKLVAKGISGFEGLIGIPGTLGGAIVMNAGAYGNEISDQLIDVIYLNEAGRMSKASKDECAFSFRSSMFREKTSYVILSARFRLEPGDRQEINRKVQACQIDRATYQEMKYPNLGSLYKTKNIYGDIAKKNKLYKYFLWILNKIKRVLRLKNNVMINFFTAKYFKIKTVGKKAFSDKTLNCLVNRGDLSYTKALQFIDQISKILGDSVELEVEIIN